MTKPKSEIYHNFNDGLSVFNQGVKQGEFIATNNFKNFIEELKEEMFQMMDNEGVIHRNRVDIEIDKLSQKYPVRPNKSEMALRGPDNKQAQTGSDPLISKAEVLKEINIIKDNLITNEDFKYRSARTFIDMLENLKARLEKLCSSSKGEGDKRA